MMLDSAVDILQKMMLQLIIYLQTMMLDLAADNLVLDNDVGLSADNLVLDNDAGFSSR